MKPDVITIELTADHGFRVHWQRMAAEQVFIGLPPVGILPMIPQLFCVDSLAHGLAARLALCGASGFPHPPSLDEIEALTLEAISETLRKVLLDWSLVFDGAPQGPKRLRQWREADSLPAFAALAEELVFGMAPATWLSLGLYGWLDWLSSPGTCVARWLYQLRQAETGCPLFPDFAIETLAEQPQQWLETQDPEWRGMPCEVSPLALEAETLSELLYAGQLARARLLARLIQLARWMNGARLKAEWAPCGRGALARVDTASGLLLHYASLDEVGRVDQYRIHPPSLWHSHPQGLIANTLNARLGDTEAEWRRQIALIDPCVAYELRLKARPRFHPG